MGRAHGYGKSGTLWRLMALAPTSPKPQHVRYTHREANWSRSPLWGMTGTMGLAGAARGVTPLLPRRTESVAGHGHDSEEHKGVGGDHSASCAGGAPVATVVCRSCGSGGHPAVGRTLVARHTALTRLAVAAVSVRGMTWRWPPPFVASPTYDTLSVLSGALRVGSGEWVRNVCMRVYL